MLIVHGTKAYFKICNANKGVHWYKRDYNGHDLGVMIAHDLGGHDSLDKYEPADLSKLSREKNYVSKTSSFMSAIFHYDIENQPFCHPWSSTYIVLVYSLYVSATMLC